MPSVGDAGSRLSQGRNLLHCHTDGSALHLAHIVALASSKEAIRPLLLDGGRPPRSAVSGARLAHYLEGGGLVRAKPTAVDLGRAVGLILVAPLVVTFEAALGGGPEGKKLFSSSPRRARRRRTPAAARPSPEQKNQDSEYIRH